MKTTKSVIEITEIIEKHGGRYMKMAASPTWVCKDEQEGLVLNLGILRSYRLVDMRRDFEQKPSIEWQVIIDEIITTQPEPEKKTEQLPATAGATHDGSVPDTLTVPLLEKWKKMTTFERILMFQNTPQDRIDERKGFKRPDGSFEMLKYVKGNFMLQEANIAFLFNWSSKIEGVNIGVTAVAVYGSISVEIDGKTVVRACVGVDEINSKVTAQHAIKNAATDMIKKGFASLGFNGDVYRGEV